jgi:hypothetical protein
MRRATRRQHHISDALILSKLVVALTDRRLYGQASSRRVGASPRAPPEAALSAPPAKRQLPASTVV